MNGDYLNKILLKYRRKGLIIDANLLLVYFVGKYNPQQIQRFKRTRTYTVDDYTLLVRLFDYLSPLITTPNILTEVSNLSSQLPEPIRSSYFREFKKQILILEEDYRPSNDACRNPYFHRLGLTDSVIMDIARNEHLVLTDDLVLSNLLQKLRIDVINFNHIRGFYLFSA